MLSAAHPDTVNQPVGPLPKPATMDLGAAERAAAALLADLCTVSGTRR